MTVLVLFQNDFRHDWEVVGRKFVAVVVVHGCMAEDAHVAVEEDEIDFAVGDFAVGVAVGVERLEGAFMGRFADVLRVFHLLKEGLDGGRRDAAVHVSREKAGEAFCDFVHAGHDECGPFLTGLFALVVQMGVEMDEFLSGLLVL